MFMTRTLSVAGGLAIAALLYVLQTNRLPLQPVAVVPERAATAASGAVTAPDATSLAIDDLAAWPAAAGR